MTLFGEVAPVSSDEVLAIGRQQLGVTASGELSWDMLRDALIREVLQSPGIILGFIYRASSPRGLYAVPSREFVPQRSFSGLAGPRYLLEENI